MDFKQSIFERNGKKKQKKTCIILKPDLAADHAAEAGTAAGPAASDLALQIQVAVFVADGHATAAAITLVVGVE
jgi:hypothetical protein